MFSVTSAFKSMTLTI